MKKIVSVLMLLMCVATVFTSCNHQETYADRKKRENAAISQYIVDKKVKVLTEKEFAAKGNTTDVEKNEFVLFNSNGIYLQIIRKGCGAPLKDGENCDVLVRFDEYNLLTDSLIASNNVLAFSSIVEKMHVSNTSGTFTGSFEKGNSLMYTLYSSASVPSGWLYPLTYINLGRPEKDDEEIAKIRVIVPSSQGQAQAASYTYPCLYELTYQRAE